MGVGGVLRRVVWPFCGTQDSQGIVGSVGSWMAPDPRIRTKQDKAVTHTAGGKPPRDHEAVSGRRWLDNGSSGGRGEPRDDHTPTAPTGMTRFAG